MKKIIATIFALLLCNGYSTASTTVNSYTIVADVDKATKIEANLRLAGKCIEIGNYEKAKKCVEIVLSLDPNNSTALYYKNIIAERQEELRRIEEELFEATKASGTRSDFELFIRNNPNSVFVAEAKEYISDIDSWQTACDVDTHEAYIKYISTSTKKVYVEDARRKIINFEKDEAWEKCKNSERASDFRDFLERYPGTEYTNEANYKISLYSAEEEYANNNLKRAKELYEKANSYMSLSGISKSHYIEVADSIDFQKMLWSNDLNDMKKYISTQTSESYHYKVISNKIARISADNLTIESSEQEMERIRNYATDKETMAYVDNLIDKNIKEIQLAEKRRLEQERILAEEQRRQEELERKEAKRAHHRYIVDEYGHFIRFGLDFDLGTILNAEEEGCAFGNYEAGLTMKFGRNSQLINFLVGTKYCYYGELYIGEEGEDSEAYTYSREICAPVKLRVNISDSFYISGGAEISLIKWIDDYYYIDEYDKNRNTISWQGEIGFSSKSVDVGLYYKYVNKVMRENSAPMYLGLRLGIYF